MLNPEKQPPGSYYLMHHTQPLATFIGCVTGSIKIHHRSRKHALGCHLSNKSVFQMSVHLELPLSAVIVMWKYLAATTAQPWSAMPHKLTVRDCWVLKHTVCKNNFVLGGNIYYQLSNCLKKQHQHKNCTLGDSWHGFPWLCSSQITTHHSLPLHCGALRTSFLNFSQASESNG